MRFWHWESKKHGYCGYCKLSCQADKGTESVDVDTKLWSCPTNLVYKKEKLLRSRNDNFLERKTECIHLSINSWIFQSSFQKLQHSKPPWLCTWTEEGSDPAARRKAKFREKLSLKAEQIFQPSAVPSQFLGFRDTVDSISNKSWCNFY